MQGRAGDWARPPDRTGVSGTVYGSRERAEQRTSTLSLRGKNNGRTCGNLSGKDVAAAEELNTDQLGLLPGHALVA
jgi:hypothetical protein